MGETRGFLEEECCAGGVRDLGWCQEDAKERIDKAFTTSFSYDWNKPFNLKTR